MGGPDMVQFFESCLEKIPEDAKTDEFLDQYDRAMNRARYEVDKSLPVAPNALKAKARSYGTFYSCGNCGFSLREELDKCCPKCGREVKWSAVLSWRWP